MGTSRRESITVRRMARWIGALAVAVLVVAACGGSGAAPSHARSPSALDQLTADEFPDALIDVRRLFAGGPPPDGIPAIDRPEFVPASAHRERYRDVAPMVVLDIGGDARAYPVAVLIWHEIVNDTVGGVPVSVTYCPLCNSATSYGREIDGEATTFGTSGLLYHSAMVMYDRATESLWTHFDGQAVVGMLAGTRLEAYPSPLMSWADFLATHPDGAVLDETRTGHRRDYGANPYVGYDDPESFPFLFYGDVDARAVAKERVVGVSRNGVDVAYALTGLTGQSATATTVSHGDAELVVLWSPGQTSAIHGPSVQYGRDVGTVGVFVPSIDGRRLTFRADQDGFQDLETNTRWSIAGVGIEGTLAGERLERVPHLDTFWFAWSTYRPGTSLVGPGG